MNKIILALGSNIGDGHKNIEKGIELLHDGIDVTQIAVMIETTPVGYAEQANFINTALTGETSLTPEELLDFTQSVEKAVGRTKTFKNGPRVLDIDIIFYDDVVIDEDALQIPHPRFRDRMFVLAPVEEIAPDYRDPVSGKTVRELWGDLRSEN